MIVTLSELMKCDLLTLLDKAADSCRWFDTFKTEHVPSQLILGNVSNTYLMIMQATISPLPKYIFNEEKYMVEIEEE